jgi:hypothetical protein
MNASTRNYGSFKEFYPFYLSQHTDRTCRALHFVGSSLVLICFVLAIITYSSLWLIGMPVCGYGFAWIGHFIFEKNKPATFQYPLYSLIGDWVMYWQMCTGKIAF